MSKSAFALGIALTVFCIAAALRLPRLDLRPMHSDEAIQADKFGDILEHGSYRYDPLAYHGPTLNYLTLLPARLSFQTHYNQVSEPTLRIVPALLGLLLVLLPFLLGKHWGMASCSIVAVLTAVSPVMVYYSRYYIQEMLLVSFTFAMIVSAILYFEGKRLRWAVAAGLFLGLMLATKETAVLALGASVLALFATVILRSGAIGLRQQVRDINRWHLLAAGAAALLTVALLMSSFLSNFAGLVDFFAAFPAYLRRASQERIHFHPWYYYLNLLLCFKANAGPFWSEAFILLLSIVGLRAIFKRGFSISSGAISLQFIAIYTILLTAIYSAIPYKTPWCLLGFWHGYILLAGVGAISLWQRINQGWFRRILACLLISGSVHLAWQSWLASFRFASDPVNPYVYAHTGTDVFKIRRQLEKLAEVYADGHALPIQIMTRQNFWPLPWYLRSFSQVSWWTQVSDQSPAAPVILASPDMEPALIHMLYEMPPPGHREMYMRMFRQYVELRPQVEIRGYVAKSLWDRCDHTE